MWWKGLGIRLDCLVFFKVVVFKYIFNYLVVFLEVCYQLVIVIAFINVLLL